ncbi:unnamed protein product [Owenia fusiformis]|uniref:Uncharacterized protein n=1 Tax=Owenia fusiformis TaxID=6347 RepID=A0A8J1TBI3_OWEFU|nr:unnamed protein product [Owenia fusiformis]
MSRGEEEFELEFNNNLTQFHNFHKSAIYKAIKSHNHTAVLEAIKTGEDVNKKDEEFNQGFIHLITFEADQTNEHDFVPMVYQLADAGIDLSLKDYKGQTALRFSIEKLLLELMIALLRCGASPVDDNYKAIIEDSTGPFQIEILHWFMKFHPGLWESVSRNNGTLVASLIQSWCKIETSQNDETLINLAKRKSIKASKFDIVTISAKVVKTLEKNVHSNCFIHATLAGDVDKMYALLMDQSLDLDSITKDISYQSQWNKPVKPQSLYEAARDLGHSQDVLDILPKPEQTIMCDDEYNKNEQLVQSDEHNNECNNEYNDIIPRRRLSEGESSNAESRMCTFL